MQFQRNKIQDQINIILHNFRGDIFSLLDGLEAHIVEKEADVKRLQEELKALKDELEYLKKTSESSKNSSAEIISLENALKTSIKTIDGYLKIPAWNQMNVEDLLFAIKYSIDKKKFEDAGLGFKVLCDNYIKQSKITNEHWRQMEHCLGSFFGGQLNRKSCHVNGIIHLFSSIIGMGWTELLDPFLSRNSNKIEKLILSFPSHSDVGKLALLVLTMYFLLSYDRHAEKWLDRLLDGNTLLANTALESNWYLNLLFISMYYRKDDMVLEKLPYFEELQSNVPEIECYNIFYDTINNLISYEEGKEKIMKLSLEMNTIDFNIKAKVIDYIMSIIQEEEKGQELTGAAG